jgi:ketosteroid isomerase-like protein
MSATATATSVQELDKQLNDDVLSGKAMEAFEKYYADDVVMQENSDEPRKGKDTNRKAEQEFFASVEAFNGGSVKASAVNGDVTFSEWEYDLTFKGGKRVKMNQVAVRRWKNGKIASERFYYNKEG